MSASTCLTGAASSRPFAVGTIPPAARRRSGSPNRARSRPSAALIADCERLSRAAARVTLRSLSNASSASSRLRSIERISMAMMNYIRRIDLNNISQRTRLEPLGRRLSAIMRNDYWLGTLIYALLTLAAASGAWLLIDALGVAGATTLHVHVPHFFR